MPVELLHITVETPIGFLQISGTESGVQAVSFVEGPVSVKAVPAVLRQAGEQMEEYFAGKRMKFTDLFLRSVGTDFQQRVWDAAADIGWGETVTYGELAKEIGEPSAARAVGTALGRNPICIIVPCHRIIASGESGGGYAWGQWRKDWLLKHEQKKDA